MLVFSTKLNIKIAKTIEINPTDTSIIIDNDPLTSSGSGFSELLDAGPFCTVHYYINNYSISSILMISLL